MHVHVTRSTDRLSQITVNKKPQVCFFYSHKMAIQLVQTPLQIEQTLSGTRGVYSRLKATNSLLTGTSVEPIQWGLLLSWCRITLIFRWFKFSRISSSVRNYFSAILTVWPGHIKQHIFAKLFQQYFQNQLFVKL